MEMTLAEVLAKLKEEGLEVVMPDAAPVVTTEAPGTIDFAENPTIKALLENQKAQQAEILKFKRERNEAVARDFINQMVREERLMPASRSAAVALFSQLMVDEETSPVTFKFSQGTKTIEVGRIDALKTFISSLPKHGLTESKIPAAIFSGNAPETLADGEVEDEAPAPAADRSDYLLSLSGIGRDTLSSRQKP